MTCRLARSEQGVAVPKFAHLRFFTDHAGRLWAGMINRLFVYERGSFRQITKPDGSALGMVMGIAEDSDVRSVFFYVEVTMARLNTISRMFEDGNLIPEVGSVLQLDQARSAHDMVVGAPHKHGIVLTT